MLVVTPCSRGTSDSPGAPVVAAIVVTATLFSAVAYVAALVSASVTGMVICSDTRHAVIGAVVPTGWNRVGTSDYA